MHPFHAEIIARHEVDARRRDAAERRHAAATSLAWPDRTGALLVRVGERFARAGHRLQTSSRAPATPCPQGC
jgi:predicted HD phosphohydrolase